MVLIIKIENKLILFNIFNFNTHSYHIMHHTYVRRCYKINNMSIFPHTKSHRIHVLRRVRLPVAVGVLYEMISQVFAFGFVFIVPAPAACRVYYLQFRIIQN